MSVYEADVPESYRHEELGVVILKKNIKSATVAFGIWPASRLYCSSTRMFGVLVGIVEWSPASRLSCFSPLKQLYGPYKLQTVQTQPLASCLPLAQ